ncbi:LacI family DNA-binding transcriptional regulator [Methylopila henanensis]|uniref:LacI family DNA-binding transcriptional regulator n=1 Tax=Methylopila henanensis TaxID=873516 RepID=A0ABW4KAJ8_9HYPH
MSSSGKAGSKSAPTMSDVARLAGVSAMTVSRALRHDGAVSQKTRDKVLAVVDELGYVPDQAAGALSSGRSSLVGMIAPALVNPIFGMVARGLNDTLTPLGLQLFIGFSDYGAEREEHMLESMLRRRPEAIAIAGEIRSERATRMLLNAGVPVVEFLHRPAEPIRHVVAIDHVAVGRAVAQHFVQSGRKRLAAIIGRERLTSNTTDRAEGLREGARQAGLAPVRLISAGGPLALAEQGVRAAAEIIENLAEIDAVLCPHDITAIAVIGELRRRGARVPDDIAVFGFGDHEVARHTLPALTTIGFNAGLMGVEIGKLMINAFEASRLGQDAAPFNVTLDFEVIVRDSA